MQKGKVLMRAREVHTAHFEDYLGQRIPVELHMNAFSHEGIEFELDKDGNFEAYEAQVALLESHGFERVPGPVEKKDPPRYILGPNGKFMSRADALAAEAALLQEAAKKAVQEQKKAQA